MMKKVLLVVLALMLVASVSVAQTSGPSNVAGYVKIACNGTTPLVAYATPFGLPFKFWDVVGGVPQYGVEVTTPSDIVGSQAAAGTSTTADKIVRHDGGFQAYLDSGTLLWTGTLEDAAAMIPGKAYWYINKTGASRDLVLAGEVDNAGNYGTFAINPPSTAGGNYATAYTWRDSRNVPVDSLQLLESGFTGGTTSSSDKLVAQVGGLQLLYRTDLVPAGWDYGGVGEPFHFVNPGKAYWIVNKHVGNLWNYNYVGVPTLPARMNDNEGVITSTSRNSHESVKGAIRANAKVKNSSSKSVKEVRTNK